uniref:Hydroxyproline-rich glycoprotein family protein n=1 Tax=Noccaea caerulescens TaxID=107243 RepID=A0A1J3I669_NOCCA
MAMPPGNVAPSDKLQFPPAAVAAGNWIPDGRDGFISWIRGEFAAANAIIDSLCQHLVAIGDHNEYEAVVSSVQQRQLNWSPVLYMQHYFSIAEVSYALQQVAWKRQQKTPPQPPQRHHNSDQIGKFGGGRRSVPGSHKQQHQHHNGGGYRGAESMARNGHHTNSDCHSIDRVENRVEAKLASDDKALSVAEEKRDGSEKPKRDSKDLEESESVGAETQTEIVKHNCNSASKDNSLSSEQKRDEKYKECPASMAKTFVVQEMYEAKMVNVVEGLKLYDKVLGAKEVSQLISLLHNLRNSGRRGQLQSEAYVGYKRPNRGRGREMIQLGLPIAETPPDDESIKDRRIEPIPSFLSDIIERLVSEQIIPVKPDACIIDFFNEGDHSQPHMFVPWFGRPVGILSLSESEFTFGRVIVCEHPGDYKGSLKLSLTPGSVLVVEGKSADLAKFAMQSTRKQRILVTFTKYQPRNSTTGSHWAPPPPSRSPNHSIRYPIVPPKHYPLIPATGVLPTPSLRPPNGAVQPMFIAPSPPPLPFPGGVPPGPTVWPLPPHPRQQPPPQPRVPVPGTGVFLPPGSAQEQGSQEKSSNSNGSNSAEGKLELKMKEEACNGSAAEECDGNSGSAVTVNTKQSK